MSGRGRLVQYRAPGISDECVELSSHATEMLARKLEDIIESFGVAATINALVSVHVSLVVRCARPEKVSSHFKMTLDQAIAALAAKSGGGRA